MNTYIEVNGEISMESVVEQIQQTYDMQVSGYYRQLHFVEDYLCKEKKISLETDNNRNFFKAWEKESESTLSVSYTHLDVYKRQDPWLQC